jgi:hypothetical protein
MGKISKLTHILAIAGAAITAFVLTPAGQAIIHQYPKLAPIAGAVATLFAVYHNPKVAA